MHEIGSQKGIMYCGICVDRDAWHVALFPGQAHMTWEQGCTEHDSPFEHTCYLECPTYSWRTEVVDSWRQPHFLPKQNVFTV